MRAKDLVVHWELGGELNLPDQYDGIVNVWVSNGAVWAGTWSGFAYRVDPATGHIHEKVFTK